MCGGQSCGEAEKREMAVVIVMRLCGRWRVFVAIARRDRQGVKTVANSRRVFFGRRYPDPDA